ncbi:MAG: hypothetical protein KF746_24215, partial [Chitinophagaceae bacterium]|nr:hypothetical protein [Chitinophagaceae bacterium]
MRVGGKFKNDIADSSYTMIKRGLDSLIKSVLYLAPTISCEAETPRTAGANQKLSGFLLLLSNPFNLLQRTGGLAVKKNP